jgi:DNA-binding NarL/FixJ family response regulator
MRICVLIVDDEVRLLHDLVRTTSTRWIVTVCMRGADAEELLKSPAEFDAILLDIVMPDTNGLELYQRLQRVAPARCDRIAFISGFSHNDALVELVHEFARPLISKPFALDKLEAVVRELAATSGPRGPSFESTSIEAIATKLEQRVLRAINDRARYPRALPELGGDNLVEETGTGTHLIVPNEPTIRTAVDKVLNEREKKAALELAAGRWAKLITFVKWGWWRLLTLVSGYVVARLFEELAKHGIHF